MMKALMFNAGASLCCDAEAFTRSPRAGRNWERNQIPLRIATIGPGTHHALVSMPLEIDTGR